MYCLIALVALSSSFTRSSSCFLSAGLSDLFDSHGMVVMATPGATNWHRKLIEQVWTFGISTHALSMGGWHACSPILGGVGEDLFAVDTSPK